MAQLRAEKSALLEKCKHDWKRSPSAKCPRCGKEEEDVRHLFRCEKSTQERLKAYGAEAVPLSVLSVKMKETAEYLRLIGKM